MIYQDLITEKEFLNLSKERGVCVSIYLPTSHLLEKTPIDRLNFRHMADSALEQAYGVGERNEVEQIELQLKKILKDDYFWIYQGKSLGVLVTSKNIKTYRLPYEINNFAKASDRFYLKPLLPALHPQAALILTISQKSVHLYEFTIAEKLIEISVPGLPSDLVEATGRVLQRNGVAEARLRDDSGKKVLQLQFVRAIEKALKPILIKYNLPLVLATTEEIAGLYRSINSYPFISDENILGSVENKTIEDLISLSKPVAQRLRSQKLDKWSKEYADRSNEAMTSSDLATIAKLASQGQVSRLLVDVDSVIYGRFDDQGTYRILDEKNIQSYDLIDEIVDRVMSAGGEVLAVRHNEAVPGNLLPISASFRW